MSPRRIVSIGLCDLRLMLKERNALIWILAIPVIFVAVFGHVFQAGSGPRKYAIAVVDADRTFASRSFIAFLGRERVQVRVLQPAERDTARGLVRVLAIPRGFEDSLASRERVALDLERVSGHSQESDLGAKVAVYKAIFGMLGTLASADSTGEADRAMYATPEFQARFAALAERPDLIRTEVRTAGKGRAMPTGFGASAPSMLVLFLLMNTVVYGSALLAEEKQSRCLSRLATMPISRTELILGKVGGRLLIAIVQSAILIAVGSMVFSVYWGPSLPALAILIVSLGLCAAALGILLGAVFRTPEQAGAVAWIIPLFLGAIGGTWWPLEVVPPWMRILAHVSPAAWAMDGLHGLMAFGKGPAVVIVPSLVLLAGAAALTAIGARLLRTE